MLTCCLHWPLSKAEEPPPFPHSLLKAAVCLVPPEDLGLFFWGWLCCRGMYGNVCGHAVCGRVWDGLDELLLFSDMPGPLPAACSDSWIGVTNSDAYRTRQVA